MMRIQVTHDFGGRVTRERRIAAGVYDLDDPRLFGAGQYLLDNGHAVAVPLTRDDPEFHEFVASVTAHMRPASDEGGDEPQAVKAAPDEPRILKPWDGAPLTPAENAEAIPALSAMTVAELIDLCRQQGIDPDGIAGTGAKGNVVKADYITALAGAPQIAEVVAAPSDAEAAAGAQPEETP